jgi:hypothetical protein
VDAYVSANIPVNLVVEGEAPEGYYAMDPTADPSELRVSGPKSIVEQIVRAEVKVDRSKLPAREGTVRTAQRFVLLDQNDQTVASDLLQVTDESVLISTVTVDQRMKTMRIVNVSDLGLMTGNPARGYEVRSVYYTPAEMPVAGNRELLDKLYAAFPDCQVTLVGLQVPSQDGFGHNYGASWKYYSKMQFVWKHQQWNRGLCEEKAYAGKMTFLSIAGQFDTEYNMPRYQMAVNTRNSTTEYVGSNGVHPSNSGYYQIADAVLRHLAGKLN